MVPLIDVSLVLVVILLVATPMMLQSGITVSKASASGARAAAAHTERVEIDIVSDDSVMVNRTRIARPALGAVLQPLLAGSATRQVVVRCADQVPHGTFVAVLDEAKARGAAGIAVVGR
ncbi:MAG: biopolymer transporter ExbD [Candidatus Eisenbacteria bacterium]|uniref:Biopolymer transporter ExbD n=1 Tax=Eiseniibacteriota bacterium TaxID=2212470 RepID=A0A9D6LC89_UNCEI|nr:biopolymer transporter ExbD [Candidatus Eisenbacteria bacterium]MBI3540453.1 biopolymer transporter ExbD [Candidatus Eisenbacteria bacterium]